MLIQGFIERINRKTHRHFAPRLAHGLTKRAFNAIAEIGKRALVLRVSSSIALMAATCALTYATPITINGLNYVTTMPTETVNAPFTSTTGVPTTASYSKYALITVSGTGQSYYTTSNDAFYIFTDRSGSAVTPTHDANYYQLRLSGTPMNASQPQFDADNSIVYDVLTGMPVTSPYTPAYEANHTYEFVVRLGSLSPLYFGVSDGDFSDNSGSYSVKISQLAPTAEPATLALLAGGGAFLIVRMRRMRYTARVSDTSS